MTDVLLPVAGVVAVVGAGLMAGLFLTASVAIMPGLRRRPAPTGIAAMQSINSAILNPVFLTVFGGTALVCLLLVVVGPFSGRTGVAWLVAGGVLYLLGGPVLTAAVNVPMNNALAVVDPDSTEGGQVWADYAVRWTAWNHARTAACTAAVAALGVGLVA